MSKEEILPSYLSKDDQIAIAVYGSEKEKCALSIRQDLGPQVIDILTTDASLNVLTVLSYNLSLTLKAAIALSRRRIIPFGLFCGRSFDEMWDMRDYAKEPHAEIASSYLFNLFFLFESSSGINAEDSQLRLLLPHDGVQKSDALNIGRDETGPGGDHRSGVLISRSGRLAGFADVDPLPEGEAVLGSRAAVVAVGGGVGGVD